MKIINNERMMVKIINEISTEENIDLQSFSYNWIFRLEKDGVVKFIMGYNYGINSSTSYMIANDKCALSDILRYLDIPHVEHTLFMRPINNDYIGKNGNWHDIIDYAELYNNEIVCKTNNGTGGNNVFLCKCQNDIEIAINELYNISRNIAVSPYYEIESEYRVIVLNDNPVLIYKKQIPEILGDGKSTILDLILDNYGEELIPSFITQLNDKHSSILNVLEKGEIVKAGWMHNLGQGALPVFEEDAQLNRELSELAVRAAKSIDIKFSSIDIIKSKGHYYILEINSGVMMEHFINNQTDGYNIAKKIYKDVIVSMFL